MNYNFGTLEALSTVVNELQIPVIFKEWEGEPRCTFWVLEVDRKYFTEVIEAYIPAGIGYEIIGVDNLHQFQLQQELMRLKGV